MSTRKNKAESSSYDKIKNEKKLKLTNQKTEKCNKEAFAKVNLKNRKHEISSENKKKKKLIVRLPVTQNKKKTKGVSEISMLPEAPDQIKNSPSLSEGKISNSDLVVISEADCCSPDKGSSLGSHSKNSPNTSISSESFLSQKEVSPVKCTITCANSPKSNSLVVSPFLPSVSKSNSDVSVISGESNIDFKQTENIKSFESTFSPVNALSEIEINLDSDFHTVLNSEKNGVGNIPEKSTTDINICNSQLKDSLKSCISSREPRYNSSYSSCISLLNSSVNASVGSKENFICNDLEISPLIIPSDFNYEEANSIFDISINVSTLRAVNNYLKNLSVSQSDFASFFNTYGDESIDWQGYVAKATDLSTKFIDLNGSTINEADINLQFNSENDSEFSFSSCNTADIQLQFFDVPEYGSSANVCNNFTNDPNFTSGPKYNFQGDLNISTSDIFALDMDIGANVICDGSFSENIATTENLALPNNTKRKRKRDIWSSKKRRCKKNKSTKANKSEKESEVNLDEAVFCDTCDEDEAEDICEDNTSKNVVVSENAVLPNKTKRKRKRSIWDTKKRRCKKKSKAIKMQGQETDSHIMNEEIFCDTCDEDEIESLDLTEKYLPPLENMELQNESEVCNQSPPEASQTAVTSSEISLINDKKHVQLPNCSVEPILNTKKLTRINKNKQSPNIALNQVNDNIPVSCLTSDSKIDNTRTSSELTFDCINNTLLAEENLLNNEAVTCDDQNSKLDTNIREKRFQNTNLQEKHLVDMSHLQLENLNSEKEKYGEITGNILLDGDAGVVQINSNNAKTGPEIIKLVNYEHSGEKEPDIISAKEESSSPNSGFKQEEAIILSNENNVENDNSECLGSKMLIVSLQRLDVNDLENIKIVNINIDNILSGNCSPCVNSTDPNSMSSSKIAQNTSILYENESNSVFLGAKNNLSIHISDKTKSEKERILDTSPSKYSYNQPVSSEICSQSIPDSLSVHSRLQHQSSDIISNASLTDISCSNTEVLNSNSKSVNSSANICYLSVKKDRQISLKRDNNERKQLSPKSSGKDQNILKLDAHSSRKKKGKNIVKCKFLKDTKNNTDVEDLDADPSFDNSRSEEKSKHNKSLSKYSKNKTALIEICSEPVLNSPVSESSANSEPIVQPNSSSSTSLLTNNYSSNTLPSVYSNPEKNSIQNTSYSVLQKQNLSKSPNKMHDKTKNASPKSLDQNFKNSLLSGVGGSSDKSPLTNNCFSNSPFSECCSSPKKSVQNASTSPKKIFDKVKNASCKISNKDAKMLEAGTHPSKKEKCKIAKSKVISSSDKASKNHSNSLQTIGTSVVQISHKSKSKSQMKLVTPLSKCPDKASQPICMKTGSKSVSDSCQIVETSNSTSFIRNADVDSHTMSIDLDASDTQVSKSLAEKSLENRKIKKSDSSESKNSKRTKTKTKLKKCNLESNESVSVKHLSEIANGKVHICEDVTDKMHKTKHNESVNMNMLDEKLSVHSSEVTSTDTLMLMEEDLDFEPDQTDLSSMSPSLNSNDIETLPSNKSALTSITTICPNSQMNNAFVSSKNSVTESDLHTHDFPVSNLCNNDEVSAQSSFCESGKTTFPPFLVFSNNARTYPQKRDLPSEDESDSDKEHSFKRSRTQRNNYAEAQSSKSRNLNIVDGSNFRNQKHISVIQNEAKEKDNASIQNHSNGDGFYGLYSGFSNSPEKVYKPTQPSVNEENTGKQPNKVSPGHFLFLKDVLNKIKSHCVSGMVSEAVAVAEKYISISCSPDANKSIFQELLSSFLAYILNNNRKNVLQTKEVFDKLLKLVNDYDFNARKVISDFIIKCCAHSDLTLYSIKMYHLCQNKCLPLNYKAVDVFGKFLRRQYVSLPTLLDFLEYVKNVCQKKVSKELMQIALRKCKSCKISEIHHICSLLHNVTCKEIDLLDIQEFLQLCFKKRLWAYVSELFVIWCKQREDFAFCVYNAFSSEIKTSGEYFKRFADTLHGQVENIPSSVQSIFGQLGTALMLNAFSKSNLDCSLEILYTLHEYNINYFELQMAACNLYLSQSSEDSENMDIMRFPYLVAFIAVATCLHFKRPKDAFTIFQGFSWIASDEILNEWVKSYVIKQRYLHLVKLVPLLNNSDSLSDGWEALNVLLSTVERDFTVDDVKKNSKALTTIYNEYLVSLINSGKMISIKDLYRHSLGPRKEIFTLAFNVIRGLIAVFSENRMFKEADTLFMLGIMRKCYSIEKPQLESFPWHMTIVTDWTVHEIKLAVEWFLNALFPLLMEKKAKIEYEKWFSVKIYFKVEDRIDQTIEILKKESSDIEHCIKKVSDTLHSLQPPLKLCENDAKSDISIDPDSLYNFWKNKYASASPNLLSLSKSFLGSGKQQISFGIEDASGEGKSCFSPPSSKCESLNMSRTKASQSQNLTTNSSAGYELNITANSKGSVKASPKKNSNTISPSLKSSTVNEFDLSNELRSIRQQSSKQSNGCQYSSDIAEVKSSNNFYVDKSSAVPSTSLSSENQVSNFKGSVKISPKNNSSTVLQLLKSNLTYPDVDKSLTVPSDSVPNQNQILNSTVTNCTKSPLKKNNNYLNTGSESFEGNLNGHNVDKSSTIPSDSLPSPMQTSNSKVNSSSKISLKTNSNYLTTVSQSLKYNLNNPHAVKNLTTLSNQLPSQSQTSDSIKISPKRNRSILSTGSYSIKSSSNDQGSIQKQSISKGKLLNVERKKGDSLDTLSNFHVVRTTSEETSIMNNFTVGNLKNQSSNISQKLKLTRRQLKKLKKWNKGAKIVLSKSLTPVSKNVPIPNKLSITKSISPKISLKNSPFNKKKLKQVSVNKVKSINKNCKIENLTVSFKPNSLLRSVSNCPAQVASSNLNLVSHTNYNKLTQNNQETSIVPKPVIKKCIFNPEINSTSDTLQPKVPEIQVKKLLKVPKDINAPAQPSSKQSDELTVRVQNSKKKISKITYSEDASSQSNNNSTVMSSSNMHKKQSISKKPVIKRNFISYINENPICGAKMKKTVCNEDVASTNDSTKAPLNKETAEKRQLQISELAVNVPKAPNIFDGYVTYNEEMKKIIQFLKIKLALKYKNLSSSAQHVKATHLAETFIKDNHIATKLDKRTMKLLTEFAETHI